MVLKSRCKEHMQVININVLKQAAGGDNENEGNGRGTHRNELTHC